MSETARIREAARLLSRSAQRAAQDLNRRIRGIEGLFGEDAARPLDAATEELREMFYGALDMHELAHHDRDKYVVRTIADHDRQTRELRALYHEARRLLFAALDEHDARQRRTAPARRSTPEWVDSARRLDDRDPF